MFIKPLIPGRILSFRRSHSAGGIALSKPISNTDMWSKHSPLVLSLVDLRRVINGVSIASTIRRLSMICGGSLSMICGGSRSASLLSWRIRYVGKRLRVRVSRCQDRKCDACEEDDQRVRGKRKCRDEVPDRCSSEDFITTRWPKSVMKTSKGRVGSPSSTPGTEQCAHGWRCHLPRAP